ncbi:hypothetical protein [Hungatella sp.]
MKRVVFLIDDELFKLAKIQSIQDNCTMTQYLVQLIEKDLAAKKEQSR